MAGSGVESFGPTQPAARIDARSLARAAEGARGRRAALWLAILLLVPTAVLWLLDIDTRFDVPYLNLAFNLIFITLSSSVIAVIGIRSFLHTGAWPVLWLGAGSLIFGLALLVSSALLAWLNANAAIAVHNLGALLAGSLHCLGAFFDANRIAAQEPGRLRRSTLWQVYFGSLVAITLVGAAAVLGLLPTFFVQGQGGTPIRQMVLAVAVLLFFMAGLLFLRQYGRTRAAMVYWYALGLLLTAVGLSAVLLISGTGTPLGWMGRLAQWLGGLYLLMAALVTLTEAKARQRPADEVLAGYFLRREANLKLLFDSILDAIIVTDHDYRITGWNQGAEATYGWNAEDVMGRSVEDLLRTQYSAGLGRQAAQHELLTVGVARTEVVQRHRDGREVAILSTVSALKDDAGRVIGAVAVNRDVTARRRAEEEITRLNARLEERAVELEASNSELEAFAYTVSHDLRAPLRGIDGFSQALEEDNAEQLDETGKDYLRMLRLNAQRMGQLIDDLLTLSRVGRQQLLPHTLSVRDLVQRAWEDLRPEWADRPVELRFVGLSTCEADPILLKQAFSNLLSNALKFSRSRVPAIIEVGCTSGGSGGVAGGGDEVFYVKDNGIGFDMQYAGKMFGVFQRLHRAEDYEGTGVGLAIVERIVQRHSGRVWAEGQPGEGATFYFTLGDTVSERTG